MEVCDKDHDEIVYCERYCPMCKANATIKDLEENISKLQDAIRNMEV